MWPNILSIELCENSGTQKDQYADIGTKGTPKCSRTMHKNTPEGRTLAEIHMHNWDSSLISLSALARVIQMNQNCKTQR